jgi:hypothetical protein
MRLGMKVTLTTILLAVGTAAFVAASAQDQNYPFPDPTHIPFTVPDNIQWEGSPSRGEQQYKIFGDPAKPGWYAILMKWYPGHFSKPHFHEHTRYITVLSGHWWVSSSPVYDVNKTYPLPPGTIARDEANTVHWDGAKDEPVILQIVGEGPAPNIPVDENGKPLPPRQRRAPGDQDGVAHQ